MAIGNMLGVSWIRGTTQTHDIDLAAYDNILCPFPVVNMAGIGGMLVPWAMGS